MIDMAKNLTLGETAKIESISGLPIDALSDPTSPKSKLIASIVMVVKQRENPDFTLDEAFSMDADEAGQMLEDFFG